MTHAVEPIANECFRCGYALTGISDDQPCPECGLLAGRSRRASDELHLTRPKWLKRLSRGVGLILLAIAWPFLWSILWSNLSGWILRFPSIMQYYWVTPAGGSPFWFRVLTLVTEYPQAGWVVSTVILILGTTMLTWPEGFAPADQADRSRRRSLLICSLMPTLALLIWITTIEQRYYQQAFFVHWRMHTPEWLPVLLATLGCVPFAILLFFQLRSLAKRARSPNLAEHCAIVGIGVAGALIFSAAFYSLANHPESFGLRDNWVNKGNSSLIVLTILSTVATLFYLWAGVLMIRFALAFRRAAKQLKHDWRRDDRSQVSA